MFEFKFGRICYFCSSCGFLVYSENKDDLSCLCICLGLLDSDINECLISYNFVSFKVNWDMFNIEILCFDGFEFSRGR